MRPARLVAKALQRYWRVTRGLTLGAEALVSDANGAVLLVRPGATSPWRLPGGPLEWGETIRAAAGRHLAQETGLAADGLELAGLYLGGRECPGAHVAVLIARVRGAVRADIQARFVDPLALPDTMTREGRARLAAALRPSAGST